MRFKNEYNFKWQNLTLMLKGNSMRKKDKPFLSLQSIIAVFACGVVALSLLVTDLLINEQVAVTTQSALLEDAKELSRIIATSPVIIEALTGQRNEKEIQPYVEKVRKFSEVQFIVVMDMNRIRKSHPNLSKVGEYYEEHDIDPVYAGQETNSVENGSLGRSLRSFTPVFSDDGKQVGAVLVGIMLDRVEDAVHESRFRILFGVGFGLLVGVLGSLVLARYIKKIMFGMEPFAIAKLFEERNAMLNSVREGIIAVDNDSRITIINEEALRVFHRAGIVGDPLGKKVDEYVPNTRLQNVLKMGQAEFDQEQELGGITLWTNRVPVNVHGNIVGAIATFRDKTELRLMAEKLIGVRNYADALRSQTHEFMNKLHVILGMIRMGYYDRLNDYVNQIAHRYQVEVGSVVRKIKDPVLAGFLLGKLARARELGVDLVLSDSSLLPETDDNKVVHELITILGNLIDNAMEAVEKSQSKCVHLELIYKNELLTILVQDSGQGIEDKEIDQVFEKGYSTKGMNRGVGLYLVRRSLDELNAKVTIYSKIGRGTEFHICLPYQSKGDIH